MTRCRRPSFERDPPPGSLGLAFGNADQQQRQPGEQYVRARLDIGRKPPRARGKRAEQDDRFDLPPTRGAAIALATLRSSR
jgi:hypothetical protein